MELKIFWVDHKTPISKKGTNKPNNLEIKYPDCNQLKAARKEKEFYIFLTTYTTRLQNMLTRTEGLCKK